MYGRIKPPSRSKLSHEKADKRVFLYNVLQGKLRTCTNKSNNWTPPVIEWDDAASSEEEVVVPEGE